MKKRMKGVVDIVWDADQFDQEIEDEANKSLSDEELDELDNPTKSQIETKTGEVPSSSP